MIPDPADTIVALASAPGPGLRAIVRLSGPIAWKVVRGLFDDLAAEPGRQRLLHSGPLRLPGVFAPLPADLYFWPRPNSYTGQDVAEVHTISSPPLTELLVAECLKRGSRAAQPGEFTLRAFLAGKRDLPRAEAVLGVIHSRTRDELKHSLAQLAGGLAQPLAQLREDLLNLLADVEAGLDFSEEDLTFVATDDLLRRITKGLALITLVQKQIEQRSSADRPFRAVLAGPPNAGKSSLFNALIGAGAALVSDQPGTTRDYLSATLTCEDVIVELVDTAGLRQAEEAIEQTAQQLGLDQAQSADLLLWCEDTPESVAIDMPNVDTLRLATKCDLGPVIGDRLATSAVTGHGLETLRRELASRARALAHGGLAPSLSRCRHHVDTCLRHLRSAHAVVLGQEPAEILAMELRLALDELGAMVGVVYTDDLLERIFSRFCIGK